LDRRKCKQCDSGLSIAECTCLGCQAHHAFQRLLGSKRESNWIDAMNKVEEFCKIKRRKLQHASKSASEVISGAPPGGEPAGSSRDDVGEIPASRPEASPSVPPMQPKAKAAPRQSLISDVHSTRI
jgi:hypothetical protein